MEEVEQRDRGGGHPPAAGGKQGGDQPQVLHQQPALPERPEVRRSDSPTLGDREQPALDAGHGLQRGPEPGAEKPRRTEPGGITSNRGGPAAAGQEREPGRQKQTAQGRPQPQIPPSGAVIAGGGQMIWPWARNTYRAFLLVF